MTPVTISGGRHRLLHRLWRTGRYFTLYKRWHLIGLEVGMSVASVALRREPTGVAIGWNADVVATAKRDLQPGEMLDGEGGYTVWGKLLPAEKSKAIRGLPLGLAHQIKLKRPVAKGQCLSWDDVEIDSLQFLPSSFQVQLPEIRVTLLGKPVVLTFGDLIEIETPDFLGDFVDPDAPGGERVGVELDAHGVLLGAEDLHLGYAGDGGDALGQERLRIFIHGV